MFPSGEEYVNAIRNINTCVIDRRFYGGQPRKIGFLIEQYAGGYSRVFPIQLRSKKILALRCFVTDVKDAKHRYQIISRYLSQFNTDYFVEFEYVDRGIRIKGKEYPIIRMEWFDGATLKNFVQKNRQRPNLIRKVADIFLQMVQKLHQCGISHGDLQDENILIKQVGGRLEMKLIDYDSLYVSDLKGSPQQIVGKPNFQHPLRIKQRNTLYANEQMDYFSELVIYTSLMALAENPYLWDKYQLDQAEGLIFEEVDFQNPLSSNIFEDLQQMSKDVYALGSMLKTFCQKKQLDDLFPLETVLQQAINIQHYQQKTVVYPFKKKMGKQPKNYQQKKI